MGQTKHFSAVVYFLHVFALTCYAGPLEEISSMPDLTTFYQQLIRQQDLQGLLQGLYTSQQQGLTGDFTIFAPNNDAMARLNRRNEDPNLLWKYHIVPGRYDDQTIYNMAQEKLGQANPSQSGSIRPQNNLPTIASPFQVFYGIGYYGGVGPYINVSYDNMVNNAPGVAWTSQTLFNQTHVFDGTAPLNPYLINANNYNPSQPIQNYVVAQGSASSGNPNLFPPNLTNYYTNVFNPNVNTQFLQNANVPGNDRNPNYQQQQNYGPMNMGGVGILRPTVNSAFILQSRPMSRGVINVIDNILWPPERRDQTQFKTAYDALEDNQFSRLRILAERSDYFRAELRSMNQQTFFLPNDQAFSNFGSGLNFLFENALVNNSNDLNDFIRAHIVPMVIYPSMMDASKQLGTLSPGKWITFRKISQSDQAFQIDVVASRQVARILPTRPEDIKIYGNGVVYPISTILSSPMRSATDELARSYQYFIALIQQSGDTELVNLLQGSTAGLGNTGPNIFNPQNLLSITVLIPQQMSVQQLGNSQELSINLRRHILRFPVYTDRSTGLPIVGNSYNQQQMPFGPMPRSNNKVSRRRRRRRRRQLNNAPPNGNFQPMIPNQQQLLPSQQQQLNPALNPNYYQQPAFPTSSIFQDGQFYPTMDPQFSVQARISPGPNGNVVTLTGRPENSLPFTATILNAESNIPVKNGVMHVVRGILSGAVIPLDLVLGSIQGTSSFTQLLQQTGVTEQLQRSGRSYTVFIPTNAALQSIGVTTNINKIRQFVLRHICTDVLLDPMANILRSSVGYYNRGQVPRPVQRPPLAGRRRKRQSWADSWRNDSIGMSGPGIKAPDLGPGYFQPQQQVFGGYPAAPSPYGGYNQLYNPSYVLSGYGAPNSQYYPGYNGTYIGNDYFINQYLTGNAPPMTNAVWNSSTNTFYSPQINVQPMPGDVPPTYYTGTGNYLGGATYTTGPQSCMAMSGDRITIQPMVGGQPDGTNQATGSQNFIVTCCGDQSVNAMVQSFNVYPPSFAVYVIGRSLLAQGQTINNLFGHGTVVLPCPFILLVLLSLTHVF